MSDKLLGSARERSEPDTDRPVGQHAHGPDALVLKVAGEHRWVLWAAVAYILLGGALLCWLDRPWPIKVTNRFFAALWITSSTVWIGWQYLRSPRLLKAALQPQRVAGALCVAILAVPFQVTFQALKQSIAPELGFPLDGQFSSIDIAIHGRAAWRWFSPVLTFPSIVRALDAVYMSWFLVLLSFIMWLSWTKHRALRVRAMLAIILLWTLGGTLAAWLGASAGPCYYGRVVGVPDPYAELAQRLDEIGATQNTPLFARANQAGLWRMWRENEWGAFGGISAMPSLHVGLAVLLALVAWKRGVVQGLLLTLYASSIHVGSVVLAWHYAIDGYAGAMIAWYCWVLAGRIESEQGPRPGQRRMG